MKTIGPDKTYIDYFQSVCPLIEGLPRFGTRVGKDHRFIVLKIGNGPPDTCGKSYRLPVKLANLPSHILMIVDDHLLSYPSSDLGDVLAGRKSFREALDPAAESKPLRLTATGAD
jgi:hypothetical protein